MMISPLTAALYPTVEDRAARVTELRGIIAGLNAAIGSGISRGGYDGKSVDYVDLSELRRRKSAAESELMALLGISYRRPTAGFATFYRGNR